MSTVAIWPHSGQVTRSVANAARVGPAETGNELADCTVTTPIRSADCGADRGMTSVIGPVGCPIGIQSNESGKSVAAPFEPSPDASLPSVTIAFLLHRREHPPRAHPQFDPHVRGNRVAHH